MRRASVISAFILGLVLSSCMAGLDPEEMLPEGVSGVTGEVMDEQGNPLEYIKVTLDWNGGDSPVVVYTSSNGIFMAQMGFEMPHLESTVLNITIEDIDGEANGGLFQTKTDRIMFDEYSYSVPVRLELSYRLTHATASESSPQP